MAKYLDKRIAILELFKAGKSHKEICKDLKVNRMLVWRTLKRYKESGNAQNQPGQGRPQTARTTKLVNATREKVRRNPKKSIQEMAKGAKVSQGIIFTILCKDLQMSPYKHIKKQLLSAKTAKKCLARAKILFSHIEAGTLPNVIFSDEKKFNVQPHVNPQNDNVWSCDDEMGPRTVTRFQGAASEMVRAAVTKFGRSPLVFIKQGVKLNQENYCNDILVGSLLPWANKNFKKRPWTFQQDLAPSHGAKKTQEWLSSNVPNFISKDEWPPLSPDLNPLDFGIWGYLESKVSRTHHTSLEALKSKLWKEWSKIPQDVNRDSCKSFSKCFQLVIDSDRKHIE